MECHPISAKGQSRVHQQVLPGIFLGHSELETSFWTRQKFMLRGLNAVDALMPEVVNIACFRSQMEQSNLSGEIRFPE